MGILDRRAVCVIIAACAAMGASASASAQDLYAPAVLRTFHLTFHDADWLARLRDNYASEALILADLVVDGVTYPDVGVRIRGASSYTALPAGSEKFSLKIDMDFVDPDQELLGYDSINLNNAFRDPTFAREVVYNNYVAQFMPNPRANHALVTLNGQNWGVYVNVQQPDKRMLRDWFRDDDGVRIGCSNDPNGPGLSYNGPTAAGYPQYQILDDGGVADPYAALIQVADALGNTPLAVWPAIDEVFALDPAIWSVTFENLLTDEDSYVHKGCDFIIYRDPVDLRTHLLQRDANETFTQVGWPIDRNFGLPERPLLNRVLAVPELRQRYLAHYRRLRGEFSWSYFGPRFLAQRDLIDAAVQADPKRLYSYELFRDNYTASVNMPYPGLAGGPIIGLQPFFQLRTLVVDGTQEFLATGPTITDVGSAPAAPSSTDPVFVTAMVTPNGSTVAAVELFYRPLESGGYERTPMRDDGNSGDGAPGDGLHGALLPVLATPGQRVAYYVAARAANAAATLSFAPELTELAPLHVDYALDPGVGLRITEWMYAGAGGEFLELTNLAAEPIDLSGWSIDDSNATPGAFALGAAGTLQPGESLVVTESVAASFATGWELPAQAKVLGGLGVVGGNNFGRNDQINLFDPAGQLEDRLDYGDQAFPGTIRTQNASGQAPCAAIGTNAVALWRLAAPGDDHGSRTAGSGDVGSPGWYASVGSCPSPPLFKNGFEQ